MGLNNISVSKLLKISNQYCCLSSGYYYKLAQIINYNWLEEEALQECVKRLEKVIIGETEFEKMVYKELNGKYLSGFIDCVDDESVWEFKCVKNLLPEHFVQLALYAYLYGYGMGKKSKLMNILTGEVYELVYEESNIDEMLKMLIDERDSKKLNDQAFLEECEKITRKYVR